MRLLHRIFELLRKRSDAPIPDVCKKLMQPGYIDNASVDQLKADHAACRGLRQFVRDNYSALQYLRYLRVLDDIEAVIQSKEKLQRCKAIEDAALLRLLVAAAPDKPFYVH